MESSNWDKWKDRLEHEKIHIVLEGGDNAGKSTLTRSLHQSVSYHLKAPVVSFSNPCNPSTYKAIKENGYGAFTIGMMTMAEQSVIAHNLATTDFLNNAVIIQDRHACISGYCYNVPYMDALELNTYLYYRDNVFAADLNKCVVVIIDTDRETNDGDRFEKSAIQTTARLRYKHSFDWSDAKIIRVQNNKRDFFADVRDEILTKVTESL